VKEIWLLDTALVKFTTVQVLLGSNLLDIRAEFFEEQP
jgi:hypothetical protein